MNYCEFCNGLPADTSNPNKHYHDTEYGFAQSDDNVLFERLVLEINQAGLSWTTILNKRAGFQAAYAAVSAALNANKKCTRANMILGDIEQKQSHFQAAIDAYSTIEKQNHAYLGMVGEKLYDAYDALGKAQDGLNVLIGYAQTFPQLDLNNVIYEKSLLLHGESIANQTIIELIRAKPDLNGMYRLLGLQMSDLNPQWKADADMMRSVIGRQVQKTMMYRCKNCHFKSQVYFWHCPACNKWETFTPNKIEV